MALELPKHSEELSGAPLADLIHTVALAVADGQFQMDKTSLRAAEFMSGQMPLRDLDSGQFLTPEGHSSDIPTLVDTRVLFGYRYDDQGQRQANRLSMMELGFVPTFYQFVDTVIDMKLTLRLHRQSADSGALQGTPTTDQRAGGNAAGRSRQAKTKTVITTSPVDARYSSSYDFSAEMTSRVKTKLVPVPPPPFSRNELALFWPRSASTGSALRRNPRNKKSAPFPGSRWGAGLRWHILLRGRQLRSDSGANQEGFHRRGLGLAT